MSAKASDLVDLLAVTLSDLPRQYFEVGWDNQDYEFCRIYQKERMVIDGGTDIKRKVQFDESGAAHYRTYYDVDTPTVTDLMKTITVPWARLSTNYSWDDLEILHNKNSAKGFINLLKERRLGGIHSLANLIEDRGWKTPNSATDEKNPYGVPYYLNMLDADASTAGFNGGTIRYQGGTTGTSCAGIDTASEAKWKNYAFVYSAIDNALLKQFRIAFMNTKFKAPIIANDPAQKRNGAKRIYTDFDNTAELQELVDAKDDNHRGKDVLGNITMDDSGLVYINRLPVVPIAELNGVKDIPTTDATSPIYCVDFTKFIPVVHDGYWMEESEPMVDRGQHTTLTVYLDGAHNNLCTNRRSVGFVGHKAITS